MMHSLVEFYELQFNKFLFLSFYFNFLLGVVSSIQISFQKLKRSQLFNSRLCVWLYWPNLDSATMRYTKNFFFYPTVILKCNCKWHFGLDVNYILEIKNIPKTLVVTDDYQSECVRFVTAHLKGLPSVSELWISRPLVGGRAAWEKICSSDERRSLLRSSCYMPSQ